MSAEEKETDGGEQEGQEMNEIHTQRTDYFAQFFWLWFGGIYEKLGEDLLWINTRVSPNLDPIATESESQEGVNKSNFRDDFYNNASKLSKGVDSFVKKVGDESMSMGKNLFDKVMVNLFNISLLNIPTKILLESLTLSYNLECRKIIFSKAKKLKKKKQIINRIQNLRKRRKRKLLF